MTSTEKSYKSLDLNKDNEIKKLRVENERLQADILAWQNISQRQIGAIERLQRAHDYSTQENARIKGTDPRFTELKLLSAVAEAAELCAKDITRTVSLDDLIDNKDGTAISTVMYAKTFVALRDALKGWRESK